MATKRTKAQKAQEQTIDVVNYNGGLPPIPQMKVRVITPKQIPSKSGTFWSSIVIPGGGFSGISTVTPLDTGIFTLYDVELGVDKGTEEYPEPKITVSASRITGVIGKNVISTERVDNASPTPLFPD